MGGSPCFDVGFLLRLLVIAVNIKAEGKEHHFFSAPPFRRDMPRVSQTIPFAHRRLTDHSPHGTLQAIGDAIQSNGIGGTFWEKPLERRFRAVLAIPGSISISHARKALQILDRRVDKADILLVIPSRTARSVRIARSLGLNYVVAGAQNPHSLMPDLEEVIAVDPETYQHDLCILAAIHDKPVQILDRVNYVSERLTRSAALEALNSNVEYLCPFSGRTISCLEMIEILTFWKLIIRENRRIGAVMGMSLWKRPQIRRFLSHAPGSPRISSSVRSAIRQCVLSRTERVAIWATRLPDAVRRSLLDAGMHIVLVEDGFVRSVGLGSALQPPASIFLDTRGVYYDPSQASDLEHILANARFDPDLVSRGRDVVMRLRARGISKYAHQRPVASTISRRSSSQRILVPGQVADDLSVLRGGGAIKDNLSLLRAVRAARPDAYIIYRPHPDVEGGYRKGMIPDTDVLNFADEISRGGNIIECMSQVDELHTMTSLAGFEALVREIPVTTYGVPFYAGWGLTQDMGVIPERRSRKLSLEELVAGTLLLYPRYLDPKTHLPCRLETLLDRFDDPDLWQPTIWMHLRRLQIAAIKRATPLLTFIFRSTRFS